MEAALREAQVIEVVLRPQEAEVQPRELQPIEVQGREQEVQGLLEVQVLERTSLIEVRHLEVVAIDHPAAEVLRQEAVVIEARAVVREVLAVTEVQVVRVGLRQVADLQVRVVAVEEGINTWPKIIQERFKI